MKAMILAAGKGTRLKPFTDSRPKALFPVENFTLLQLTILYLKKHGITELVVNVHHFSEQIVQYMEENKGFGLPYQISDESDQLLDTGGALVKARQFLDGEESFVLMGADVMTGLDLSAMIQYHKEKGPLVTLGVKDRLSSRSLIFDNAYQLKGWRDNSSGKTIGMKASEDTFELGFSTVHVIQPRIFDLISECGAFPIMPLYLKLMETEKILGFRHDESSWIEFGRIERIPSILKSSDFQELIRYY